MKFGVITAAENEEAALAAGADYIEPTIVGNVIEESGGRWAPAPGFVPTARYGSFAILFPGSLAIADPATPLDVVGDYLKDALGAVAGVARPGALIVLGSGGARTIPDGTSREAGEARFAETVRQARDIAESLGLEIVLEPLNRGESNLLNSLAECAAFLDEHGIERVKIVADLYHIVLEQEPLDVITRLGARIGHAHVADSGRAAPGTGDWPIAGFLDALRAGGYAGHVSLECNWGDLAAELPGGLATMRALRDVAGVPA